MNAPVLLPRRLGKAELVERSYDVIALLEVCEAAAIHLGDNPSLQTAGAIARTVAHVRDLVGPMHDALEFRLRDQK